MLFIVLLLLLLRNKAFGSTKYIAHFPKFSEIQRNSNTNGVVSTPIVTVDYSHCLLLYNIGWRIAYWERSTDVLTKNIQVDERKPFWRRFNKIYYKDIGLKGGGGTSRRKKCIEDHAKSSAI
jgi:hypothetical protein